MQFHSDTTIFAPATAPGRAGIAVLRISGPRACDIFTAFSIPYPPAPRMATFVTLKNPLTGEIIDQCIALYFAAPASYTGEDVVELHVHGSRAIIKEIMETLSALPFFAVAAPGEFTKRAFLNGKLDLTQAESVMDLIDADTEAQKRQALRQMQGEVARFYTTLRTQLIETLAHLEATIDFPEEDIPPDLLTQIGAEIKHTITIIEDALADNGRGEKIRDGISVAIIGAPNVGKSSLLNFLARRDVAIVSEMAGTTRDVIEVELNIGGYVVNIADTAGLRESLDVIENEGMRRARMRSGEADFTLAIFDSTMDIPDAYTASLLNENSMVIISKVDCKTTQQPSLLQALSSHSPVCLSVMSGEGCDAFLALFAEKISKIFEGAAPVITQARHRQYLQKALDDLKQSLSTQAIELRCEELRRAAMEIGKITGKIDVDDVLGVIFQKFCIGK